jgi:hypothetical protein
VVRTTAGDGTGGHAGDNAESWKSRVNNPAGVAVDSKGAVYVADEANHRVRRIAGGAITTYAGTGTQGFSGNGGQAVDATLNSPAGLVFDASDNLFIAEAGNNCIRRVAADGFISTAAGVCASTGGYAGNNVSATDSTVRFNGPRALTRDESNSTVVIYVADTGCTKLPDAVFTGSATNADTDDNPNRFFVAAVPNVEHWIGCNCPVAESRPKNINAPDSSIQSQCVNDTCPPNCTVTGAFVSFSPRKPSPVPVTRPTPTGVALSRVLGTAIGPWTGMPVARISAPNPGLLAYGQ